MCCGLIVFIKARATYAFTKPAFTFVVNDTVPGQDDAAMIDFRKLNITTGEKEGKIKERANWRLCEVN